MNRGWPNRVALSATTKSVEGVTRLRQGVGQPSPAQRNRRKLVKNHCEVGKVHGYWCRRWLHAWINGCMTWGSALKLKFPDERLGRGGPGVSDRHHRQTEERGNPLFRSSPSLSFPIVLSNGSGSLTIVYRLPSPSVLCVQVLQAFGSTQPTHDATFVCLD